MNIPITKPFLGREEIGAVNEVLRSGWVTQGPKVAEFERMVAEYVGVKYAIATTSATTSLFLSLHMLGIGPGDEVLVPSFSFIATANVVVHTGATPVFIDINPSTYNIDPTLIEKAITKKTKAIIPVDQVGLPADLNEIKKIAKKYKLHVVEDAACALGSVYKGKRIGNISELTCLSFHPRKCITTGEGGMILTNNKKYAQILRMLRHHGMNMSDVTRHTAKRVSHENYPLIGYNFRMSDIQAAIGIEQLKKLPEILRKRNEIANFYSKKLLKSENIILPFVPQDSKTNWQSYVIRLKKSAKISRDEFMQKLLNFGIASRRGVMASHLEIPYKKMFPKLKLINTEASTNETVTIPLYIQMTKKEQIYLINSILKLADGK